MPTIFASQDYTMVAAGGAITFDVNTPVSTYNLIPNGGGITLTGNLTIAATGTPVENMQYIFNYGGLVIYDGATVTVFGRELTAQEALSKYIIVCNYIGAAWQTNLQFGSNSYIAGGNISDATITSAKLVTGTIALNKIDDTTRGNMIRAGVGGVQESFVAVTAGQLVMGNGTDVVSQAVTGDIAITGGGVTAIQANAIETTMITDGVVTVAKLTSELQILTDRATVSFETGEQGAYKMQMKFSGSVTNVYAAAVKAIAATDSGTVILKDNAGTTMTVTTPIVFAASDAFGTAYNSAVTANNTFVAGDVITITTAKVTVGGKALVTLTLLRS